MQEKLLVTAKMLFMKRRLNEESTGTKRTERLSVVWKIYLEEMTVLVSSGMATVTHSTQVKKNPTSSTKERDK